MCGGEGEAEGSCEEREEEEVERKKIFFVLFLGRRALAISFIIIVRAIFPAPRRCCHSLHGSFHAVPHKECRESDHKRLEPSKKAQG